MKLLEVVMDRDYFELSLEQSKQKINTLQLFEAYLDNVDKSKKFQGSLSWREIKGNQYLIRQSSKNGKNISNSLGVRSPKTEEIFKSFTTGRESTKEKNIYYLEHLDKMAKMNKILKITRVPIETSKILRKLNQENLLGKNLMVIGTNAIYGYESWANVHIDSDVMETEDLDILWDARTRLKLGYWSSEPKSMMDLLKETDSSFERVKNNTFRAVNKTGFFVDFLKATPKDVISW